MTHDNTDTTDSTRTSIGIHLCATCRPMKTYYKSLLPSILISILALVPTASAFVHSSISIRALGLPHKTNSKPQVTMTSKAAAAAAPSLQRMAKGVSSAAVAQFAPQAIDLFNNMKTPASILAGSMVPILMASPLAIDTPADKTESRLEKGLRAAYLVVGVMSLLSELCSVMWATVAVNQLIETNIAPAASVWHLIKRDFDLQWVAVNAHFVLGMLGFSFVVGTRAYFQAGGGLVGKSVAGLAGSGVLLMIAIVNRGVAAGGGEGVRYGATVWSLISRYIFLLTKRASTLGSLGPLEVSSIGLLLWSVAMGVLGIAARSLNKKIT